ncbi:invasion associated locus B family protein [Parvibaculum sp.]|uniref:invasion associated locus B family protein n=1 Tax=Parvibaculum sp. TaxID=2024848 RepID=UPI0032101C4B
MSLDKLKPAHLALIALAGVLIAGAIGYLIGNRGGDAPQASATSVVQPEAAPWVKTASFGAWDIKCREVEKGSGEQACIAVLEVQETKSKQTLLAWILSYDQDGKLLATIHTLSGVQLDRGIDIGFGTAPVRHVQYASCMPLGCDAIFPVDEALMKEALAAGKSKVSISTTADKVLNFDIPLDGLDKAVEALRK